MVEIQSVQMQLRGDEDCVQCHVSLSKQPVNWPAAPSTALPIAPAGAQKLYPTRVCSCWCLPNPAAPAHLHHGAKGGAVKLHHQALILCEHIQVAVGGHPHAGHEPCALSADFDHAAGHRGKQPVAIAGGQPA
jgi:hypothetical protein